ncbi:MAG: hypothetical protein SH857_02065 [Chitinophagales bacterium]|nr:hypothetical protein [Chitinophagales bacterium]
MVAKDFYLAPLFLMMIYGVAFLIRNKYYADSPLKKYFIPGLSVKLIGAFFSGLIYWYYYGGGDTIHYFMRTKSVYDNVYKHNIFIFMRVIFADTSVWNSDISYIIKSVRGWDSSMFMVLRFSFFLSMFTFCSYLGIAFMFAALSFSGIWKLFTTFADINPALTKEFATACLFIPSVFFWGSGLFKDTIAIGFVGWFTASIYKVFIKREKILPNLITMAFSFFILYTIKAYIIMAFLPSLLFWIFFKYRENIKNDFIRKMATPLIIVVSFGGAYLAITQMGGEGGYWSADQMTTRAKDMQWWHAEVKKIAGDSGGGSFYSIGTGDFSLGNIIMSFPLAVNVTFFRPYLWEARNPVMILAAVESLVLFLFTLKLVFNVGLPAISRISILNPEVFFCLLFAIIFAFAVGFSSFNFGALVRYKIPCIPFFLMALYMIRYHATPLKNNVATKQS